jgi:hypothetical protein
MKTTSTQLKSEIVRLLQGRDSLKVSPLYIGAVLSLESEGKVKSELSGNILIVRKA